MKRFLHYFKINYVRKILFFFFLFTYITNTFSQVPCSCDKRKKITINNTGGVLNQYQIRINVVYDTDMATDFSDLRFTTNNETTEIPYWIETYQASASAIVWVKVPTITATTTTDIYMYYGGCSSTGNTSNATDVFEFFDDMNSISGWSNIGFQTNLSAMNFGGESVLRRQNQCDPRGGWKSMGVTLNNFRLITREQRPNGSTGGCGLNRYGVENNSFNGYSINRNANVTGNANFGYERRRNGAGGNLKNISLSQPKANWYRTELRRCQTGNVNEAVLYNDDRTMIGSVSGSISSHNYSNFDRVVIRGGREYYVDFMAVAKYTCTEPTVSIGNEETINKASAILSGTASICNGESATLTVNFNGTAPWAFTYTDGVTPITINNITTSTHTFPVTPTTTTTTTYSLVSVSDALCSGTVNGTATVTVNSIPNNTGGGFKGEYICLGDKIAELTFNSINNSATTGNPFVLPYTIVYKNRDTNIEYTQLITSDPFTFTPEDTPTAVGTYRYELVKITNGNGCERTSGFGKSRADVRIFNPPVCSITGADSPVCPNKSLTYTAPTGMETYNWTVTGNATISGASNTQTVNVVAGNTNNATFTLKLTIVEKVHRFKTCESVCEKTITVADATKPTFNVPTTVVSKCVNNIQSASYANTTNGDVNNPPDYYEFTANDTVLDINTLQDNCCTTTPTISWSINPASNGVAISGTGQPSQSIGGKKLWLNISTVNPKSSYTQKVYTITYSVTDCNGNTATKTRNIIITPRPKINRVE